MESAPSNNLFFSIKAVNSDSFGVIPFVVRTHWGYTKWTKLTFSFLASASDKIAAGYYQVDTATLSSCISGKQIFAFIPTNLGSNKWIAQTFLNGFEITSVNPKNTYFTPYEVQVVIQSISTQGLTLLISTTSATQIHSLFISYVAFDPTLANVKSLSNVYDKYVGLTSSSNKIPFDATNAPIMFGGITGFILGNTGSAFKLDVDWNIDSNSIDVATGSKYYYLSYGGVAFVGGPCGYCTGYSINYNGNCVASCPPSSYYNGVTCVTCQAGEVWDGSKCVAKPVVPTTPTNPTNPTSPTNPTNPVNPVIITCPAGTYWDGQQLRCLPCLTGCATCVDCYTCNSCSLGFYFQAGSNLCT